MIYRLQKRFVIICTVSVLSVVALIFGVIFALNVSLMNRNVDVLADSVSEGGGRFPETPDGSRGPDKMPPMGDGRFNFITPETPFATRHFTVLFNSDGSVQKINTEFIYSITEEKAVEYASKVIGKAGSRGWADSYRYKVFLTDSGMGAVFVDGSVNRASLMQSMTIAGAVLLSCAALVLLLIILLSKRAVKPIAESYEKQKQFVTDANHELKTPLTLILANLDIAEQELGQNEWLDDIRAEGHRMTELVNQLVALSRMDEEGHSLNLTDVYIGDLIYDAVIEFEPLIRDRGKSLSVNIDRNAVCRGDEALLYRLIGLLMDNAAKYCDEGGEISVTLRTGRRTVLTVENTYAAVVDTDLSRLFDRFYRVGKSRSFTGGYGIGLSTAKAIVEQHRGEITAYKKDSAHIGFKVVL